MNNNGHLSFIKPSLESIPYSPPSNRGEDIIAPLWTDIDISQNGVISYQQYTDGVVLAQAARDINWYFPDLSFIASWVFVVTWDRVSYFHHSGTVSYFIYPGGL